MEEDYVTLEVAKLLKKKGFDEPCFRVFTQVTKEKYRLSRRYPAETKADICSLVDGCAFDEYLAPSLAQTAKWLRKIDVFVSAEPYDIPGLSMLKYKSIIQVNKGNMIECVCTLLDSFTYEQALNDGIKEAMKMI